MALLNRSDRIDQIEARIERLTEAAADLLAREREALAELEARRARTAAENGRFGARRRQRAVSRAAHRLEHLRAARAELTQAELEAIVSALHEQSRRTRSRLDQELMRLAPVQAEWERLRGTFHTLAEAVAGPALEPVADRLPHELEVPEFPLAERDRYAKPFPEQALVF